MMNRLFKTGVCCCSDCNGPDPKGRAWEKQDWMREVVEETRIRYGDSLDPRDWAEE